MMSFEDNIACCCLCFVMVVRYSEKNNIICLIKIMNRKCHAKFKEFLLIFLLLGINNFSTHMCNHIPNVTNKYSYKN